MYVLALVVYFLSVTASPVDSTVVLDPRSITRSMIESDIEAWDKYANYIVLFPVDNLGNECKRIQKKFAHLDKCLYDSPSNNGMMYCLQNSVSPAAIERVRDIMGASFRENKVAMRIYCLSVMYQSIEEKLRDVITDLAAKDKIRRLLTRFSNLLRDNESKLWYRLALIMQGSLQNRNAKYESFKDYNFLLEESHKLPVLQDVKHFSNSYASWDWVIPTPAQVPSPRNSFSGLQILREDANRKQLEFLNNLIPKIAVVVDRFILVKKNLNKDVPNMRVFIKAVRNVFDESFCLIENLLTIKSSDCPKYRIHEDWIKNIQLQKIASDMMKIVNDLITFENVSIDQPTRREIAEQLILLRQKVKNKGWKSFFGIA